MLKKISYTDLITGFIFALFSAAIIEYFHIIDNLLIISLVLLGIFLVSAFINNYISIKQIQKKFLSFKKKGNDILPQDMNLVFFNDYYYSNSSYNEIINLLKQKKNVLITGKPKAGKTRTAYEVLRQFNNYKILKFKEIYINFSEIDDSIYKGKVIIFIDDVNKYLKNIDFYILYDKLIKKSKEFIILSTCRSGNEFQSVNEFFRDYINDINIINIDDINKNDALEISQNANITFNEDEFDGSIGSLFLGNKGMKRRFIRLNEESKVLFKMLKLLIYAGIFYPKKELLELIYLKELNRQAMNSNFLFETILEQMNENSFIIIKDNYIMPLHDSYLDFINFNPTITNLTWIKEILIENKYYYELYRLGLTFTQKELYNDSLLILDEVIKINPEFFIAWNDKGVIFGNLDENENAIECFNKALDINPNYVMAIINKGSYLANNNKTQDALNCFNKAIDITPNLSEAWLHKGKALVELSKNEEALTAYDKSIELNPENGESYLEKGILMGSMGDNEAALTLFNEAINKDRSLLKAWLLKALALEFAGKNEESALCLSQMSEIFPDFDFDNPEHIRKVLVPRMRTN